MRYVIAFIYAFFFLPPGARAQFFDWVFWIGKWGLLIVGAVTIYHWLSGFEGQQARSEGHNTTGRSHNSWSNMHEENERWKSEHFDEDYDDDYKDEGHDDELRRAYETLGVNPSDPDEKIKKRYRAVVKECHVDGLPKGLPDYLVEEANRKFRQVRNAYEKIMKARDG